MAKITFPSEPMLNVRFVPIIGTQNVVGELMIEFGHLTPAEEFRPFYEGDFRDNDFDFGGLMIRAYLMRTAETGKVSPFLVSLEYDQRYRMDIAEVAGMHATMQHIARGVLRLERQGFDIHTFTGYAVAVASILGIKRVSRARSDIAGKEREDGTQVLEISFLPVFVDRAIERCAEYAQRAAVGE